MFVDTIPLIWCPSCFYAMMISGASPESETSDATAGGYPLSRSIQTRLVTPKGLSFTVERNVTKRHAHPNAVRRRWAGRSSPMSNSTLTHSRPPSPRLNHHVQLNSASPFLDLVTFMLSLQITRYQSACSAMSTVSFHVQGSAEEPYNVTFQKRSDTNLSAYCTCPAGKNGQYCKHRINIMAGSTTGIVSGNQQDVEEVLI